MRVSRRHAMTILGVASSGLLSSPPAPAAASPAGPRLDPGPPAYPAPARTRDVPITMGDGTRLYADVYRPAHADGQPVPGRFPVVLVQTPYNKNSPPEAFMSSVGDETIRHGYVQVVVDVRGTGSSEGVWELFGPKEQGDYAETARWAVSQPFSDGRLALYGLSYLAINQFLTAQRHPPGLRAIFPISSAEDLYRDLWRGGDVPYSVELTVLAVITVLGLLPPGYTLSDPEQALEVLATRLTLGLENPLRWATSMLTGGSFTYDGPFYRFRSPGTHAQRVNVPTFLVGGWFDVYQRGVPRLYDDLPLAPGRKQLLMGPWYHSTFGEGLGRPGTLPPVQTLALLWFDRWVKGIRNGIEHIGPVTSYQLGTDTWASYRSYPPSVRWERLYLRKGPNGSAFSGGGMLSTAPPRRPEKDSGPANILNGWCTRSTTQWTAGVLLPPGQPCEIDNRLMEATAFTYTTQPLRQPTHICGPLSLTLHGAITAEDTNWIATVSDVAPDGTSTQLTAGALLSSRRALDRDRSVRATNGDLVVPYHPFTQETVLPVPHGKPVPLNIEIFNTDAVIPPGHRLRLTLSMADLPTLGPPPVDLLDRIGTVSIHYGPHLPSYLTVPIAPS